MKAWLNLRYTLPERIEAFRSGLQRHGYEVVQGLTTSPGSRDVMVTWNRINGADICAKAFERQGLTVLVAENAAWGNEFAGERWYSLAQSYHNRSGQFPVGEQERWQGLKVDLHPWRVNGTTVILPQRGIGPRGISMPAGWAESAQKRYGGRIRPHPGRFDTKSLEDDLEGVSKAVTWGSGAAIKCLLMGIPVVSEMPKWIGEQDNTDEGRLRMFERLAWAQWRLSEIASGEAFARFL